jgi:tRNA 2-thiouridine synthesizing protein D
MHYVISTTWGPTDPTRASLPFIFADTALQAGDTVTIMLFHDSVTVAVKGSHEKMIPVGPSQKFEPVLNHPNARVLVCKPCADARGITVDMLVENTNMAGMNDYHAELSRQDSKAVNF